jgi:hypothetical protein
MIGYSDLFVWLSAFKSASASRCSATTIRSSGGRDRRDMVVIGTRTAWDYAIYYCDNEISRVILLSSRCRGTGLFDPHPHLDAIRLSWCCELLLLRLVVALAYMSDWGGSLRRLV